MTEYYLKKKKKVLTDESGYLIPLWSSINVGGVSDDHLGNYLQDLNSDNDKLLNDDGEQKE